MNKRPWTCTRFPHHEVANKYSSEHREVLQAVREISIVVVIIVEVQIKFGTAACSGSAPVSL